MQIMDMLEQMGGIQSLAREFGVSESQAASGAAALLPAILGGFKKQTQRTACRTGTAHWHARWAWWRWTDGRSARTPANEREPWQ